MGIEFRSAQQIDREAVIALWQACGLTRPWNPPENDFNVALTNATSDIILGHASGELVGCVMVGFDGHRGWVYYLGVASQHRKAGYGRALMDAAEDWLAKMGARKIQLMVRHDNGPTIAFYKSLRFDEQSVITLGKWID